MTTRIIFLAGHKQVGKDTAAEYLVHTCGFKRLAFADPLRDLLYDLNPVMQANSPWQLRDLVPHNSPACWESFKTLLPEDYRTLLRQYGAAIGSQDPQYFTRQVQTQLERDASSHFIITDTRLPVEFELYSTLRHTLKDRRTELWLITRDGAGSDGHFTEQLQGMPVPDIHLDNSGTLDALHTQIFEALVT